MLKNNLKSIIIYTAAIAVVVALSIPELPVFEDDKFIGVFQKFTFSVPVLFVIAAFLAFRIAETRVALISLTFLVLSLSNPLMRLVSEETLPESISVLNILFTNPDGFSVFYRELPFFISVSLFLVFITPNRFGTLSLLPVKIIIAVLPFVLIFMPGFDQIYSFLTSEKYFYGDYFLPWPFIVIAVLPAFITVFYHDRRYAAFSPALSSILILSMLPLMMPLNPFLAEVCILLSGVILLHSLYRVYWENSYIDELTGLFNRRALDEKLKRLRKGFSLSMVDIDHFKKFNDTFGHDEGDNVLRLVASILYKHFSTTVYRYGGEEFCVVFLKTDVKAAAVKMNSARKDIEEHMFSIRRKTSTRKKSGRKKTHPKVRKVKLTVSSGISAPSETVRDVDAVLKNADKALYKAKENGRNRVEILKKR